MTICPACKSAHDLVTEQCEDDLGDTYTAFECNVCGWRSDDPTISIAGDTAGACEGCGLPIRSGDFVLRFADVAIHHECPKGVAP